MPGDDFIHRIDKFKVAQAEIDNFVARVSETHRAINDLEGCIRNEVLLKTAGDGEYNVVTHVVWRDQTCLDAAILHMKAFHERRGGKPALPADAAEDRAVYRSVSA
ncbi:antibiotic biosynthesis monooxygenase [Agrobacterium cavarae]|uniref:antibiotic biosynthesis monooxygenase n=1 Tax=Agrobacterium cavarae TaxID=2528239 RepID=UPI003FD10EAE